MGFMAAALSLGGVSVRYTETVSVMTENPIKYNKYNRISISDIKTVKEKKQKENIRNGLYIVPNTQDYLFIKAGEETVEFHASWKNIGSINSNAFLSKGKEYSFKNGDDEKGDRISGTLLFEDEKVRLKLNEEWFLPLETEYIWLRDSMWEFSDEQLEEIAGNLGVPEDLEVKYVQDEACYWDEGERYIAYVHVLHQDKEVAGVQADSFTGEMVKEIYTYSSGMQTGEDKTDFPEVDVEAEVLDIREDYNEITQNISNHKYTEGQLSNGAVFYMDEKGLVAMVVPKNTDGSEYSRSYYYRDGELFFAYYEGKDAHRFYLTQGRLIRWRYSANAEVPQEAVNHDRENSREYLEMEKQLNQENYALQPYLDEYFGL